VSASTPLLSVVVPVHQEEQRLESGVRRLHETLAGIEDGAELLVVENGSTDRTWEMLLELERELPLVRALRVKGRGKGRAIREGMLGAAGRYRFLCDVDLSMPPEQLLRFLPPARPEVQVAIGSREIAASEVDDSFRRRFIGRCFNAWVRLLLPLGGLRDTQCGFKCFRADAAEDVFPRQVLDGLCFDVEILSIARHRGWTVEEVPITWIADDDSRVRIVRDSVAMAGDVLRVAWRLRRGRYD
jgi:glycosyltransferase involved in cell wall biosynthesis